ncbi:superoxide dismutase family protein [Paenibacillus sp.]|uniref:superoxide dismutase family protein n=1 Tax=Paenibacillus sp. TaxID=58172 RepID=UPI002811773A|nr:superoxide dismutase family protein [Paenibacillus sp.]
MTKKQFSYARVGAAFLCGSVFFSGLAMAQTNSISVSFDDLKFMVRGEDRSSANGTFDNQGTKVPESMMYQGTTYVPIRMVGELLGQPVHWDGTTKSVYLGETDIELVNADGEAIGRVSLSQAEGGVRVSVEASNLTPGLHGFHLHEKAFETNDFKTAGGHYNPHGKQHGSDNPAGSHVGDFENLNVGEDGTVAASFVVEGLSLDRASEHSIWGKSFMIHAGPDDYKTDPSGNSGDRIAGGNID